MSLLLLTYNDYISLGGTIDNEEVFNRHNCRAEGIVMLMTHGRAENGTSATQAVQYAMLALIEAINADYAISADGREVASISNDGVSISYAGGDSGGMSKRYAEIVRQHLAFATDKYGTPLLFAG